MMMTTATANNGMGCQWIGPESRSPGTCTCTTLYRDSSYCEEHYGLVYKRGTALRKRHKDLRIVDMVRDWEDLMNEAVMELVAEGEL